MSFFVLPIFVYWMPIHYDTIEDDKTKNLIFYSLIILCPNVGVITLIILA